MFPQPDIRLDIADQIRRERLAEAERSRLAAQVVVREESPPPRRSQRLVRAVVAFAGGRFFT
jgi:hypothetical protein